MLKVGGATLKSIQSMTEAQLDQENQRAMNTLWSRAFEPARMAMLSSRGRVAATSRVSSILPGCALRGR